MLIKGFSIFISCGRFDEGTGVILGLPKEHFCEIIIKSNKWPMRKCRFKTFSILSSGGHFVQQSRTISALLVKGRQRNISVKVFRNRAIDLGGDVI